MEIVARINSDCQILVECEKFLDENVRIGVQAGKKIIWAKTVDTEVSDDSYTPREKIHHEKEVDRITENLKNVLADLLSIAKVHNIKLR